MLVAEAKRRQQQDAGASSTDSPGDNQSSAEILGSSNRQQGMGSDDVWGDETTQKGDLVQFMASMSVLI